MEQLTRRADHLAEKTKELEEAHYILSDSVGDVKQKMNVLKIASKEQERHIDSKLEETEEVVSQMASKLHQQEKEIKSYVADIAKKLPIPSAVTAKGKIRKRLLLWFECAYGTKPDFVLETKHWSKWLRVVGPAISLGMGIMTGDAGSTLEALYDIYTEVRRKDVDPKVKMETLTKEPFLTSSERDELIEALRDQGFF